VSKIPVAVSVRINKRDDGNAGRDYKDFVYISQVYLDRSSVSHTGRYSI